MAYNYVGQEIVDQLLGGPEVATTDSLESFSRSLNQLAR